MSLIEDTLIIFIESRFVIGPRNNLSEWRLDKLLVYIVVVINTGVF